MTDRRAAACVVGALTLLCGSAPADPPRSLEPLLREVSRDLVTLRRAHPASALPDGRLRVMVLLAPGVSPAVLGEYSIEEAAGQVVPVRVAPDRLDRLARTPGVLQVEACRRLRTQLDRSAPGSGVVIARQQSGLDGKGVLIGIVDTGIDFRHRDFLTAAGKTRIRYILDFSRDSAAPRAFETHGAWLYTAAQIDDQLAKDRALGPAAPATVPHQDTFGHGTHVAGIAAGNGAAAAKGHTSLRYVGMAPKADLVVVKASRGDSGGFADADAIHAIQFVFERAKALKMPAVVNLSLGTQMGPHDGTSVLAAGVSALTVGAGPGATEARGQIIVSAASNDGGRDLHAVVYPRIDGPSQVTLEIPKYEPTSGKELVQLELWTDAADLSLELTSPGGRTIGPVASGTHKELVTDEGLVKILNAANGPYQANNRYKAVVLIDERQEVHPAPGKWTLTLSGSAFRADVWLVNPGIVGVNGSPRLLGPLDPDMKLGSPGTARGVISVGAYSSRVSWNSVGGKVGIRLSKIDHHAYFSSTGPTLDGRFLPDLVAPGEFIISALSRHASPLDPRSAFYVSQPKGGLWFEDRERGLLRGTSQASPHVAGVVALLLQKAPQLTTSQVREILRVGSRVDSQVGAGHAWSPRWGFGKLDARLALAQLDGSPRGALDPRRSGVGVNRDMVPPNSRLATLITVIPRDATGLALGPGHFVEISATAGHVSLPGHVAHGRYEARFTPQGPLGATARITVKVDGVELDRHPKIFLTTRRALIGNPLEAHGGCSIGGASGGALLLSLLLLSAGLALRRRRAFR